ncbi:MAG TPA: PA2779 family protein [Steroidobacteraceae bacterium]|nr:PA2779 family protein [Steroidobacteraceae bacterium]HQW10149.1 PA2779 family protein [Steroidobacteraceae bacterium]HQX77364.1 PA2779 family protein [Steroidobacteraceae bacterium]
MIMSFRRGVVALTLVAFVAAVTPAPATAAMIDTSAAVAASTRAANLARIDSVLARADVQQRLTDLGVAPEAAHERAAALTDTELAGFAAQLENAPAGGEILAVIGLVFVVLMILEFTGVIDIFKKA